jgi:molecular chaperone DnaK
MLENAIYQAEKMPDEYKDKISDDDKKAIADAVEEAKKVQKDEGADKDALEAASKKLTDTIMPIGAKLYEEAAKDEAPASEGEKKSDNDEPVEGEVVHDKDKK